MIVPHVWFEGNIGSTLANVRPLSQARDSRSLVYKRQLQPMSQAMMHLLDRLIRDRAVAISAALFQQVT
jgi:hypothetical protein